MTPRSNTWRSNSKSARAKKSRRAPSHCPASKSSKGSTKSGYTTVNSLSSEHSIQSHDNEINKWSISITASLKQVTVSVLSLLDPQLFIKAVLLHRISNKSITTKEHNIMNPAFPSKPPSTNINPALPSNPTTQKIQTRTQYQQNQYQQPKMTNSPIYFWGQKDPDTGFLSQWYPCSLTVDGTVYRSVEMWMMVQNARLFGDEVCFLSSLLHSNIYILSSMGVTKTNGEKRTSPSIC